VYQRQRDLYFVQRVSSVPRRLYIKDPECRTTESRLPILARPRYRSCRSVHQILSTLVTNIAPNNTLWSTSEDRTYHEVEKQSALRSHVKLKCTTCGLSLISVGIGRQCIRLYSTNSSNSLRSKAQQPSGGWKSYCVAAQCASNHMAEIFAIACWLTCL
jgi:hypothetical protein